MGQDPWLSFPSLAPVYLAGRDVKPDPEIKSQPLPLSEAARAWVEIKDLKDTAVFEAFRKQYGPANALYDTLAAQKIAELKRAQVAVAPPQKPIVSEDACDGLLVSVAQSSARPCIKPGSGESFKDCPDCPEMVIVPSGSFTMGSPSDEPERESWKTGTESPQHEVSIGKLFAVGRFHITRGEFARFVKATGHKTEGGCYAWTGSEWKDDKTASWRSPGFSQDDSHPVVCVNWNDAKAYAVWLSKQTGKTYRLLSEAEYEYAARAGTATPFWWGSSITPEQANYDGSADPYKGGKKGEYRQKTMPVKSFEPNPWGLYQVHGNAWSWVEDCWHDDYKGAPNDGSAWTTGDCGRRVLRGGSWINDPRNLRVALRNWFNPVIRNGSIGFRLARTLNP